MPINIYYIDDEIELCEIFDDYFSSENIKITTFDDPDKAIVFSRNTPPDLIFIDYRLPKTTGDKVALKINSDIPKFLVSGDLNVKVTYPFKKIITKPYNFNEIQAIIDKYLFM